MDGTATERLPPGGLSSTLFKLVKNRIPTRLANKLTEAHHGSSSQVDLARQAAEPTDQNESIVIQSSSYRRYSDSTENLEAHVPGTPPPVYRSKTSLHATPTTTSSLSCNESSSEDDSYLEQHIAGLRRRNVHSAWKKSRKISNPSFMAGGNSGIRVGFANQGLNMLFGSAAETQQLQVTDVSSSNAVSQPSLTRYMYMHGTQYILRGLPENLANEEAVGVWSSLPKSVKDIAVLEASAELAAQRGESQSKQNTRSTSRRAPQLQKSHQSPRKQSILHRLVAALTLRILLFLQFLAPYIQYLFSMAYVIERKHQVTEKVVASGFWSMDRAVKIGDNVCRMNDGKVGKAIGETMVWWVEGITGGIQQGVGNGLTEMGFRR